MPSNFLKPTNSTNLLPENIPAHPEEIYKNKGWNGWGDFLDTDTWGRRTFVGFAEGRKFAQSLGLKCRQEWMEYCQKHRPQHVPVLPRNVYEEWQGWGDWLGTGNKRRY